MEMKEIYENLSALDISAYVTERGAGGNTKLSYLPWANAYNLLMQNYPDATFKVNKERWLDNTTVETRVSVTIGEHTRQMWLPVMGNRNESLENPTTREISDARMRCLVKCLSLFGLGASLFQKDLEDVPNLDAPLNELMRHNEVLRDNMPSVLAIKECLASNDYSGAYEAWSELEADEMKALWRAPSKGGIFTTAERGQFKTNEWNSARKAHHGLEDEA